jgi:homoserine O-acetyltransferase/O-succinyltransferase
MRRVSWMLLSLLLLLARAGWGYDGIVDKKTFSLPRYTTVDGQTIKIVQVGWESYGTLSPGKGNVILITHFYSGTSHAAGRYTAADAAPG